MKNLKKRKRIEGEILMIIRIPKENKEEIIRSLQHYFYNERSEEIGNILQKTYLILY